MVRGRVDHQVDVRFGVVFALLTVGLLGGAAVWVWSVRDRLPDPIARHWSGGQADRFAELPAFMATWLVLPLLFAVPFAIAAAVGRSPLATRRCLGASGVFVLVFLTVLYVDSVRVQLDLPDASAAPAPNAGLAVGSLLGLVGVALAFALIRDRPDEVARGPHALAARRRPPAEGGSSR